MINEYTPNRTGWARFSDDRKLRFRLRRLITPRALTITLSGTNTIEEAILAGRFDLRIIVWIMLNPSTADAFKPDRTIDRCVKFTQIWGGDVCEVVNLHAFISAYPAELKQLSDGQRFLWQAQNDVEILEACKPATRIVAAWGTDGDLDDRARQVCAMLSIAGAPALETLGLTKDGHPLHPLARGKHFVPYDRPLIPYQYQEAA